MNKPVLTVEKVYGACKKYGWFTGGTNNQYEKLFEMVASGASLEEIALIIWLCTSNSERADIKINLANYCLQ